MDMQLITKLVSLGVAGFKPADAIEVVNDFEIVNASFGEGKYIMAVYRLSEGEGVLVWLKGYRTSGLSRKLHGVYLFTVSHFRDDGEHLDALVAIYVACKRLGLKRLRSYYPAAIPGITGVCERPDVLVEQPSFDEQMLAWKEDGEDKLIKLHAALQLMCHELDGAV